MFRRLVLQAAVSICAYSAAQAGEFGNIFGPAEQLSRQASALALEGISGIFIALRDRELKNISDSSSSLLKASDALSVAFDKMQAIKITDSENISLESAGFKLTDVVIPGQPAPKDLRELYALFLQETKSLAEITRDLAKSPPAGSILPKISQELSNYIRVGDVVSQVAARVKR